MDLCVPACQRSSCFPSRSAFPRSCTTFFRVPLVSCVPVPVSRSWCKCGGGGATHHTRAVCVWTDQAGRVNSPPRHYPPPWSCVRGVRVYWREASLGSNSCLVHNRPLPPLLSVHVITVSSLHRNANLAVLFFRVPHSRVHE